MKCSKSLFASGVPTVMQIIGSSRFQATSSLTLYRDHVRAGFTTTTDHHHCSSAGQNLAMHYRKFLQHRVHLAHGYRNHPPFRSSSHKFSVPLNELPQHLMRKAENRRGVHTEACWPLSVCFTHRMKKYLQMDFKLR